MILDLIVLIVLVIPMAIGLARGFAYMFIRTLGWLGALAAGIFLRKPVAEYLGDHFLGAAVSDHLTGRFSESTAAVETATEGLPGIISGGVTAAADEVSELFVQMLTNALVNIISFVVIILAIRLVLQLLVRPVSRRRGPAVVHGLDRALGMTVGAVQGILLVFILLALLVPVVNLGDTEFSAMLVENLRSSFLAGSLYDGNLLLVVTGGLFG